MKRFICLLAFAFTLQIIAQDNDVLANAYLLKTQNMMSEQKYDEAVSYLKKAASFQKEQKTQEFLKLATQLYTKKKNYKTAKQYADLYFKQENNKSSDSYKAMLLLYVDINENLTVNNAKRESDFIASINSDYYKVAQQFFDNGAYEKSNAVVSKYFATAPDKSSSEYQQMLLLKVDILDKLAEKKETSLEKNTQLSNVEDVPFAIIEEVPVFPGCTGTNKEKKECLNHAIKVHVARNFNADLGNCIEKKEVFNEEKGVYEEQCVGLSPGRKRIYIQFKIDYNGRIIDISVRSPHPKLTEEAIRVVKKLPPMKPGMQRGKPVRVGYILPISFNVE